MKKNSSKKRSSSSKKRTSSSFLCDNMITRKNKTVQKTCKKIETKLKNKNFRKKLIIGSVIFLLFNLAIILMLSRKTLVYKLTKYFAQRILEGANPQERELINNINNYLPMVIDVVSKHADKIKNANDIYESGEKIFNDVAKIVEVPEKLKNYTIPGAFPSNDVIPESSIKKDNVPESSSKKLDEKEAKKLIDELVSTKKASNNYFDNDSNIANSNVINMLSKLVFW